MLLYVLIPGLWLAIAAWVVTACRVGSLHGRASGEHRTQDPGAWPLAPSGAGEPDSLDRVPPSRAFVHVSAEAGPPLLRAVEGAGVPRVPSRPHPSSDLWPWADDAQASGDEPELEGVGGG
jgi:hypothetical protein